MSFDQLLHAMMSADNAQRGAAEAVYTAQLESQCENVAQALLQALVAGPSPDGSRVMSAVLLRQLADPKRPYWSRISPQVRYG